MSHFAKVENGIVTQVIVAEQDVIDSGLFGTGWIQTSSFSRVESQNGVVRTCSRVSTQATG